MTTMTDLRDRIAAVLATHAVAQYCWGPEGCSCDYRLDISDEDHPFHQADAVIRELGLRTDWAVADSDGDLVYVGSDREKAENYTVQPGDHLQTRYVTEWTTE